AEPVDSARRVRHNLAVDVITKMFGPDLDDDAGWVADDFVNFDHRLQLTTDREAHFESRRLGASMGGAFRLEHLAAHGERHLLTRGPWPATDGAEVEFITAYRCGERQRSTLDVLALTERLDLLEIITTGTTGSGEAFEFRLLALGQYDDDGLIAWAEWFELNQRAEALARFDELDRAAAPAARPRR